MSRVLPGDVRRLIFSYFTITGLQEWNEDLPSFPSKDALLYFYGSSITPAFNFRPDLLTPFEQYLRYRILRGDLVYNGHLYLPIAYMLLLAVQQRNKFFIQYYSDRMPSFEDAPDVVMVLLYLSKPKGKSKEDWEIFNFLSSRGLNVILGRSPYESNIEELTLTTENKIYLGLAYFYFPFLAATLTPETEFPVIRLTDIEFELQGVFSRENHRNAMLIRDYLSKFPKSTNLNIYRLYLDVLLGDNIDATITDVDVLGELLLLALTVCNLKVYNIIKAIGRYHHYGDPLYSEVIYDTDLIDEVKTKRYYTKMLVSLWLAGKQSQHDWFTPIIKSYDFMEYKLVTGSVLKNAPRHLPYPAIDRCSAETAYWLSQHFDLSKYSFIPDTYVAYLVMTKLEINVAIDKADLEEMKSKYEKMNKEFEQLQKSLAI